MVTLTRVPTCEICGTPYLRSEDATECVRGHTARRGIVRQALKDVTKKPLSQQEMSWIIGYVQRDRPIIGDLKRAKVISLILDKAYYFKYPFSVFPWDIESRYEKTRAAILAASECFEGQFTAQQMAAKLKEKNPTLVHRYLVNLCDEKYAFLHTDGPAAFVGPGIIKLRAQTPIKKSRLLNEIRQFDTGFLLRNLIRRGVLRTSGVLRRRIWWPENPVDWSRFPPLN